MVLPKLTNKDFVRLSKNKKKLRQDIRNTERKIDRALARQDRLEHLLRQSENVREIYEGVALGHWDSISGGWFRCDHEANGDYRQGHYWDNAHNPGKGEWNIELKHRWLDGAGWREESRFFKFNFGTERECLAACKNWAAFGELPKKEE